MLKVGLRAVELGSWEEKGGGLGGGGVVLVVVVVVVVVLVEAKQMSNYDGGLN